MKRKLIFAALVVVLGIGLVRAQDKKTLTVFAAASLSDAFTEMKGTFEAANAGVEVEFNFGSSSTLAQQLGQGAPADVFASANNTQMQAAVDAKRIAGKPRTFVKNRLVLIVPADNPAKITGLHDLANPGIKLILAAPKVPVRDYTDAMLTKLAADPAYGDAYKTAVLANVVSEEQDVRQVSTKVALGEGDAGIVYKSDVTPDLAPKVLAFPIPDAVNTLATYPIAVTNNSANPDLAKAFADMVLSDAGQDILVKWGFISVRIPALPATITLPSDNALHIEGQFLNPIALNADDLRKNYTPKTVDVTFLSGTDSVTTTYTGVLLWDIVSSAQPNFNADVKNDKLSMFIVATGTDGYQAVIAWGEIDPDFGNQPILVAYEEKGQPLSDKDAPFRLVVPGDGHGGRYVSHLVSLSLRDAPGVSQ